MISYKLSARFSENYVDSDGFPFGTGGSYAGGVFEMEPWICALAIWKGTVTPQLRGVFATQCEFEKSGRLMQIPYFILSLASFCLALKALSSKQSAKIKDIEKERSFE
jgi:hypothetical protein